MLYLIGQILFLLVLTALMSGAMGWLLRSLGHETHARQQESEWTAKLAALRSARDEYRERLERLQSGGAALLDDTAGGELDDTLKARVAAHVSRLEDEITAGRERLASLTRKLEGVIDASAQRETEFNALREQLEAATAAVQERDARLEQFSAKVTDAARQQTENARNTQRELASRAHELEDRAHELEDRAQELEQTVEVQKLRIRELESASEAEREQVEHSKLLNVIQAQKKTIENLNQRVRRDQKDSDGLGEQTLKRVLRDRESAIVALQERLRETSRRAEALQEFEQDNARLEQALAERDSRIAQLERAHAELAVRPDPAAQDELIERLAIRDETIANLQSQLRQLANAGAPEEDENRYARMMEVIRAQEETIARLNERLRRRPEDERTRRTVARASAPSRGDTLSGDLFEDRPATILDAPDGKPDDLQRIHGVGPILEGKLNELGVYHFRQIAAFGEEEIAWISTHMSSFPNRVIRDRWIDQAVELERQRSAGDAP